MINIATNLGILRAAKRLTLKQVSEVVGIATQTIDKYEDGVAYPGLENLIKLAHLYGVTLDEIVFGKWEIQATNQGRKLKLNP